MAAAAQVEFPAVPRAGEVEAALGVVDAEAAAIRVESLLDAFHKPALADRAALMGTFVMPGKQFSYDAENTDFDPLGGDHAPAALGKIGSAGHENLHMTSPYSGRICGRRIVARWYRRKRREFALLPTPVG